MAGNLFSGWYGRRSGRPYFDELPRIAAGEYKHLAPGLLTLTAAGQRFTVRLVRVLSGCMTAPRLICARCGRSCRVIYLRGMACCYRCTGAIYRTHSESPARRAVRRAMKIFRRKLEPGRPAWKPKWQRWATYDRLEAAADAVLPIIERDDNAFDDAIARIRDLKPKKRGRPRKQPP